MLLTTLQPLVKLDFQTLFERQAIQNAREKLSVPKKFELGVKVLF